MSLMTSNTERAKYGYLLQLSQDQIKALEVDDLFAFDRILSAKRSVIESLSDSQTLVAADPTLVTLVSEIEDTDKAAQRLLYRKLGRIMREMSELNQVKRSGNRSIPEQLGATPEEASLEEAA
jgi:hypothetical protein